MDGVVPFASHKTHFHIFWTATKRLDWQCFDTREEAEQRALELVRIGEQFSIEEVEVAMTGSACMLKSASAS